MAAQRTAESRSERRKRETRERLLAASLRVFLERGFGAATTAEMAAAADVGAGTFYLHFKDKRDVYETIVRHAAREMIARWHGRLRRGLAYGDYVALALRTVAEFWEEDRARARLLLEGGPTFSAEAHLAFVEDIAEMIGREFAPSGPRRPRPSAAVTATVIVGLGIEIGRLIVADPGRKSRAAVEGTIEFARRAPPKGGTSVSMLQEFKQFAMRGNVIDMAVGVIIGGAFGKIVSSFTNDVLMPPIGLLLGKVDFSNLFVSLSSSSYPTLAEAKKAGAATLNYGLFINTIIDFLIIAFVLFLMIREINKLLAPKPVPPGEPTTKECPYCLSQIAIKATRCAHCTSQITG
jgi:large conductance mechanosensitive channel